MSRDPAERQVRLGARLASVLAALVALVLGVAIGVPGATLGGVGGGVILAAGARALVREENATRAAGSAGLVVGSLALLGGIAVGLRHSSVAAAFVPAASLGVAVVVLDAFVESPVQASPPVGKAVKRSAAVIVPAAALAATWHLGVLPTVLLAPEAVVVLWTSVNAFLALVALQFLAVVTIVLVGEAIPVLDRWIPDLGEGSESPLERFGFRLEDVPVAYWALLMLQVLVLLVNPSGSWFGAVLGVLSDLGTAIELVLVYGVFHLPLVAVALLAVLVLVARGFQVVVMWWAGPQPATALAYAAGGAFAAVVVTGLGAIPPVGAALGRWASASGLGSLPGTFGATAVVLLCVVGALVVVRTLLLAFGAATVLGAVPDSAAGYAAGGTLLFVAALAAAVGDAPAVVVFAGAAGSLLVWDLGENTTTLREQLGRGVDTREVELTHAVGSAVVGVLAVVVATGAMFLLGPAGLAPPDEGRALVALALALAALLAFVYVAENPLDESGTDEG
ncbi:hypothetical protein BRD00_00060 [Halobacteriales archaeon QS_8_69_26]|nr:MAG: hypothetical protein BRD00_00060 [Halobacteriales archaeon QS_8_69_26]